MKTSTLKRMTVMLFVLLISGYFTASAVLTISSMKGTGLPMYAQHNSASATTLIPGLTLDYKVVSISGKSWAWTNIHGANIGGASYSSQLRYYSSTLAKTENNLLNRVTSSTTQTYGSTTNTIPAAPLKISFFQDANGFNETDFIPYDITAINSPVSGDITAPVISSSTSTGVTETAATINITGTDDSGDLFYYITGNGIAEISFLPTITLAGLTPTTNYNLTVTPIDFTGNMGTPSIVSFTTAGLVQITSGIAQDIKFVVKSTASTLEFYYQYTDPTKRFNAATLGITPAGGTAFDVPATVSPDSLYCYGSSNDASINGKIITLNFKYFTYKLPIDYTQWIVANTAITSGTLTGTPIKHQMGSGISTTEAETTPPVLTSVILKDATPNYVKLNINGSDNSGTVYYKITGAKSSSDDAFRTGDYYLTDINPGKIYNLIVTPYDLSGNLAAAQTITVKTMNARSTIKDSTTTNYNTLILPVAPNGELVTIIKQSTNVLTLGCTTKSLFIAAGASRNKKFNNPTVVINGTTYPLTISADSLTATTTFTGTIGSTAITNGTSFGVQWSVFWGSAGPGGAVAGGHYFTPAGAGAFTYVIGDSGQNDVTGPSAPVLTLNGNSLTWPACTDDLSGVKLYTVSETGQTPVTIFDLGGTSFSYNMVSSSSPATVTAMDFVGNTTIAKINQGVTANEPVNLNSTVVYPNPATERIYISGDVAEVALYSLQGQLVRSVINKNNLDVSTFAKGLYLVRVTDKRGIQKSSKLEIQ